MKQTEAAVRKLLVNLMENEIRERLANLAKMEIRKRYSVAGLPDSMENRGILVKK